MRLNQEVSLPFVPAGSPPAEPSATDDDGHAPVPLLPGPRVRHSSH